MNKIKAFGICIYKTNKKDIQILLCKSVKSRNRWGCLKGVQEANENNIQTALREFYEESSIKVKKEDLEDFLIQQNDDKDIGIYLVNAKKINNIDKYFFNNELKKQYISKENSIVKFFKLSNLPLIKNKQKKLINNINKLLNK